MSVEQFKTMVETLGEDVTMEWYYDNICVVTIAEEYNDIAVENFLIVLEENCSEYDEGIVQIFCFDNFEVAISYEGEDF